MLYFSADIDSGSVFVILRYKYIKQENNFVFPKRHKRINYYIQFDR